MGNSNPVLIHINDECIKNVVGEVNEYEALDTDHHGHPLRLRERLSNKLELKVGARVILRRNMHVEGGPR